MMDIKKLFAGARAPHEVNVVVEIPQGSSVKYELNKETGMITVDRFVYTAFSYPFNYGFIPGTKAPDGDPEDVLVISSHAVHPGTVIPVRPIGMLEMEDESGGDNKILAVPTKKVDPFYAHIDSIDDLPDAVREKIRHFFEHYKELEKGKWVKVNAFAGKEAAEADIQKSLIQ